MLFFGLSVAFPQLTPVSFISSALPALVRERQVERLKCKRTDTSATELPGVSLAPIQVVIGENKYVYYVPALLVLF